MILWVKRLFGLAPPRRDFTFMGQTYNGDKWEKVPDPSDMPPVGWRPPGGDWNNWKQDMMVRRKAKR